MAPREMPSVPFTGQRHLDSDGHKNKTQGTGNCKLISDQCIDFDTICGLQASCLPSFKIVFRTSFGPERHFHVWPGTSGELSFTDFCAWASDVSM